MEVVGEEGITVDDLVTFLKGELYDFSYLQQNAFDKEDTYCPLNRQIILFEMIQKIFDAPFSFNGHDEARNFFLSLQSEIKNMNFMPFDSDGYRKAYKTISHRIENACGQT